MSNLKPITIFTSVLREYCVASLIDRINDTDTPFTYLNDSNKLFLEMAESVYLEIFTFILLHDLEVNLVVGGEFVEKIYQLSSKTLNLLKTLVTKKKITIVLDAYYGNSTSCLYNTNWWSENITKSKLIIEDLLLNTPQYVYLPQLFRSLPIEKVIESTGITEFLLTGGAKNPESYRISLINLRKMDGQSPEWINNNNLECVFNFVPQHLRMIVNTLYFSKSPDTAVKAFCMNLGLQYNKYYLRPSVQKSPQKSLRINEKYNLSEYTHLERSLIRLWEYASFLIASEENNDEYGRIKTIAKNFAYLQDPFYFWYLKKELYHTSNITMTQFTSPYEAYVSMQSSVKHLEILLKNKI
jgi:hypothetical protein